ncbi:MAG: hypothetical protein AAGA48_13755 [Myxococcota bacterium]
MPSSKDIAFFQDLYDEDLVFAARGPAGADGFFLAWLDDDEGGWEHLIRDSPRWDRFHQLVFRAHRAVPFEASQLPAELRTVPPTPSGPWPAARSYLVADRALPVSEALRARAPLEVQVVLHEDLYETRLGDGRFHYLDSVHFDPVAAASRAAALSGPWSAAHQRVVRIEVDDEGATFPNYPVEPWDQHHAEQVLAAVEALLDSTNGPSG